MAGFKKQNGRYWKTEHAVAESLQCLESLLRLLPVRSEISFDQVSCNFEVEKLIIVELMFEVKNFFFSLF